jgi:aminoglycoside 3-N-acetyltransferase
MIVLADIKRRAKRSLHRLQHPVSPDGTRKALAHLLGNGADILFVHSSLSACGRFTAGPQDILAALREVAGTLGLPTHTYSYPQSEGVPGPLFDRDTTPSQNGALTELFRKSKHVVRSIQSTHSIAMVGPLAYELTRGHYECDTPAGVGTPYARMIDRRAAALMWGVTFHAYTFYHTAEDAAGSQFAYEQHTRDHLRVIDECGAVRDCVSRRQTRDPRRFAETGELMERNGLVRRTMLGAAPLLFVPDCAKAHDFLVERLREAPDFLFRTCKVPLA